MATFATLKTMVLQRLDESGTGIYVTDTEVGDAINRANRLFAFLTLCVERTAQSFSLTANQNFYDVSATFTDWLLPLRVKATNTRVLPCQLHELDLLNPAWEATTGTPTKYFMRGFYFLGIYPKPSGAGTSLTITYAGEPAALSVAGDTPEVPEEHHSSLADYAIWRLRLKEGGQELAKSMPLLERFMAEVRVCNQRVRARSIAQGYDRVPFDLEHFDISRLIQSPRLQHIPLRKIAPKKEGK